MRKTAILFILLLTVSSVTAAASEAGPKPGMTPGNPFYVVEKFVEAVEVRIAGILGGEELKAKAIANNAEERLAEAEKLKARNRTEKAEKMAEKYRKGMNRSRKKAEKAGKKALEQRIDRISEKNREVLKKVRDRTPEQADKGLEKGPNATDRKDNTETRKNISEPGEAAGNISDKPKLTEVNRSPETIVRPNESVRQKASENQVANLSENENLAGNSGNQDEENLSTSSGNTGSTENLEQDLTGQATAQRPDTSAGTGNEENQLKTGQESVQGPG